MKKIFSFLLTVATTLAITTSCADIPMPYDIFANGDISFGEPIPYKSATMYTDWTTCAINGKANPWSQGASYTQATGYQKWDGTSKTNKDVEGYLISPAINTKCESGKVKVTFDHVIGYSNNDSQYKEHIGFFVSNNFDGKDASTANWTKLNFNITAEACNSTWTLVNVGEIQLPEEFVGKDSVYFAFYMKSASAEKSLTWEPMNFYVLEGEAVADTTKTDSVKTLGTKKAPLTVAEAQAVTSGTGYVTGYIVGYIDGQKLAEGAKFEAASAAETELLLADAADCKDATKVLPVQLPANTDIRTKLNPNIAENIGKKVVLYGSFENYFGTMGMKSTSWAVIDGTEIGIDPDKPVVPVGKAEGTGTKEDPYNVAAAIKVAQDLGSGNTTDKELYIKGKISRINSTIATDVEKYGNVTFFISDDGTTNNEFEAYQVYGLGGQKITDANLIKVGDEVVLYGKITNYKGNTYETTGKGTAYIYSLNGVTEGGSTSDDGGNTGNDDGGNTGSSEGITFDGTTVTFTNSAVEAGTETISVDLNTLGFANQQEITTIELSDGTKIVFDKGSNTNTPKFYDATKGVRLYANNTITFEGKKPIARIVITCDYYNNTNQVGNATATISFDGNKAVYTNAIASGAGTQLRAQTITITYAK